MHEYFNLSTGLLEKKKCYFRCMLLLQPRESPALVNRKIINIEISDSYLKG